MTKSGGTKTILAKMNENTNRTLCSLYPLVTGLRNFPISPPSQHQEPHVLWFGRQSLFLLDKFVIFAVFLFVCCCINI